MIGRRSTHRRPAPGRAPLGARVRGSNGGNSPCPPRSLISPERQPTAQRSTLRELHRVSSPVRRRRCTLLRCRRGVRQALGPGGHQCAAAAAGAGRLTWTIRNAVVAAHAAATPVRSLRSAQQARPGRPRRGTDGPRGLLRRGPRRPRCTRGSDADGRAKLKSSMQV